MNPSTAAFRPVAWACYALALLLCLAPLGDLAAGLGSLNPGQVPWRFGAAGLLSGALVLPMLGLGLVLAAALLLEHRGVLRVFMGVSTLLLAVVLLMLVVFALDSLQVRVQVRQDAKRAFDLAAAKAAVTFVLEAIVLGVLAVQFHRAAGAIGNLRAGRRSDASPLVMPSAER